MVQAEHEAIIRRAPLASRLKNAQKALTQTPRLDAPKPQRRRPKKDQDTYLTGPATSGMTSNNAIRLGFTTSHHDATYAFAHRDRLTIHLAQTDSPGIARTGSIYMHVDDADRLATAWRQAGVEVVGPEDFDYGKREGSHTDPDGNLIRFGSPLQQR